MIVVIHFNKSKDSMTKYSGIILGIFIFFSAHLYAMNEDFLFARTADDVVVRFPKRLLPQMKTFQTMSQDFPAAEAIGSLDNPFPSVNVSADDFTKLRRFLFVMEQRPKAPQHKQLPVTQESEILTLIVRLLSGCESPKYEVFTRLIRTADYLEIDLLPMLKKYPSFMQESVEDALKAGLQKINELEGDLLIAIKNEFIDTICHHVEMMWEIDRNRINNNFEKIVQTFPADYVYRDTYMKRLHKRLNLIYSSTGSIVNGHGKLQKGIFTANIQLILPPYQNLFQMPHQEFILKDLARENITPQQVPFPGRDAKTSIYFSPDDIYCVFSSEGGQGRCGATRVWGLKGLITELPLPAKFFSAFIDEEGKEKLVAILSKVVDNIEQHEKIVIIDPNTGACTLAWEMDDENRTRAACITPNGFLMRHSESDVNKDEWDKYGKNEYCLELFDCKKKKKYKVTSSGGSHYKQLISWVDDKKIKVVALKDAILNTAYSIYEPS
jgi:hypothetical protein